MRMLPARSFPTSTELAETVTTHRRWTAIGLAAAFAMALPGAIAAEPREWTPQEQRLLAEHVYGGLPSTDNLYFRRGYVLGYNPETRTPGWVAYRIVPEYRLTPTRQGPFEWMRDDPDIEGEPAHDEFRGLFASRGYARGHLAPYAVMGGDRDHDGQRAEFNRDDPENVGDVDDALTVFEANYMSNIVPQHHEGFNSGTRVNGEYKPGLWYELERWVQDKLVSDEGREVWVFAGCIFGPGEHEKLGPNKDIWVPPMFFQIVIYETPSEELPVVLAFLLPHQRVRRGDLSDFLVTVDAIESLTGLDFFVTLNDLQETALESQDTGSAFESRSNLTGSR